MDPTPPDLTQLMAELGPLVEAAEVLEVEADLWVLAFNDEFAVEIEYDEIAGKLVLTTELGELPSGDQLNTCRLLLNVAVMWRETGGLRMGLHPVDDIVMQIYDFPVAGLKIDDLQAFVRNFVNTALHSRSILAADPNDANPDDFNLPTNLIRV